jgi:hypothetical protein
MPERSSVAQIAQIGPEVTPGTAVAATKRLGSLTLEPSIQGDGTMFRPQGLKFPTTQVLPQEWAEVKGSSDTPTYEEVIYPLSGAMGQAITVTQVMDGATPTGAYEWVFTPNGTAADNPKTFTLESGQSGVQAEKFAHLLFQEFGLEISRTGMSLSTSAIAQKATGGITPTPALAVPSSLTPINPATVSVYFADNTTDLGGLTGTGVLLNRVISANPKIGDRYNPAWFVNADPSFSTFVENADGASSEFGLTVEADTQGSAWLARYRAGTTHFVRIEAKGPVIYNAGVQPNLQYLFQWDLAVKVKSADSWSDEDGIYAIPWTLQPVYDGTWGKAMTLKVRNKVSAL